MPSAFRWRTDEFVAPVARKIKQENGRMGGIFVAQKARAFPFWLCACEGGLYPIRGVGRPQDRPVGEGKRICSSEKPELLPFSLLLFDLWGEESGFLGVKDATIRGLP